MAIHMRKVLGGAQPPRALAPARWCGTGSYGSGARRTRKSLTSSRCRGRRSRPPRKMIRAALESCGEMQDLVACAGELTRSRGFAQLVGDLSIMLGAGNGRRPHHRRQNASAHRMTSAAVEMMIPSAAIAKSRRVGNRASWPMMNWKSLSSSAKSALA